MKALRFNFFRALFAALTVVLFSASFTGCSDSVETETEYVLSNDVDEALQATWVSPAGASFSETYTITDTTFAAAGSYEGNELLIRKTGDDSGYIYLKYTKSMNTDYSYSESAPDVGKWYAVSYKGLTQNTIQLSGAYKAGGVTSKETLEEAVEEFTIENGYFAYYSSLVKQ